MRRRSGLSLWAAAVVVAGGCGGGGSSDVPLAIIAHPSDRTVYEGETASFIVGAVGTGALTYQWRQDGADIGGTVSQSYTTPPTSLAHSGTVFTCVVADSVGSMESNPATLTVVLPPPEVTGPADQAVVEGETATFTVTATGHGTLTYQWSKDGLVIGGAVGPGYTTPATVLGDSGARFTCVVTDDAGSTTSREGVLTVAPRVYMIVDLATGGVSYAQAIPDLLTDAAYRTTKLVLRHVAAGTFQMGDLAGGHGAEETPVHTVRITQRFYMGVFEVTFGQWHAVWSTWPGAYAASPDDMHPVDSVSWDQVNGTGGFIYTLQGRTSAAFRLPTEAEWEYCCRAESGTNYSYGDDWDGDWMWYWDNAGHWSRDVGTTVEKPNAWGLYDMHGNVWEWCQDWYDDGYYIVSPQDDPPGPASGTGRVIRGGSWANTAYYCRSSARFHETQDLYTGWIGFRVACAEP